MPLESSITHMPVGPGGGGMVGGQVHGPEGAWGRIWRGSLVCVSGPGGRGQDVVGQPGAFVAQVRGEGA